MLLTQPDSNTNLTNQHETITRISKNEMIEPLDQSVDLQRYSGLLKPPVPQNVSVHSVQSLHMLAQEVISKGRANDMDFAFFQDISKNSNCPEYNGYNVEQARRQGHSPQPKTNVFYLPLIDMKPSHPDTIMTSMTLAKAYSRTIRQKFVVYTCDLQLYKVALQVQWTYPHKFSNFVFRLGGMHSLMSFIGSIGTLMVDTGLSDIMCSAFGGVAKMLNGKKVPTKHKSLGNGG